MKKQVKRFFVSVLVLGNSLFLQSCLQNSGTNAPTFQPSNIEGTNSNLFIIATDASVSASSYALKEQDLKQVYEQIARTGGGRIALLSFGNNSFYQEPTFIDVPAVDTTSTVKGSSFDKTKRMALNQSEIAKYQAAFKHFSNNLNIDKNHTAQFTDISGGFLLINSLLDDSAENQEVIVLSDMVNDLPPKHGYDKMKPINFTSSNVKLHFVRPDEHILGMPVDSLFQNALSIQKYASFRQIFFKK